MWSLRRPSETRLDRCLEAMSRQELSYPEVGMTRDGGQVPAYYGREDHQAELEIGFEAAAEALATFASHRLPYMFLYPGGQRVREGLDIIVCARVLGLWTINPCRVVWVEQSDDRYAYGYGTLPGHSEHGEESFEVRRRPDGRVSAMTSAWARPQDLLARLGSPLAHRVQRQVKIDYMRALERVARASGVARDG